MSVSSMNRVMQRIRQVVVDADDPCESDADLLGHFLSQSDSRAVSILIRRHAPMVWGVCRRILFDHHDAEDAFQATFLVLLRKANAIKPRSMVGNWLHGVALQTALKARAMTMKRNSREKPMARVPDPASKAKGDHPLLAFLDEELNRLPEKYRVVLLLCDLQGKTRAEAAKELGWAEGTVASRLGRGRQMLAQRLGRHGKVISAIAVSALLANNAASAAPAAVVATTVQAAMTIVSAKTVAAAGLSQHVITLADGVMKTMFLSKLKAAIAVVLLLGFIGTGAAVLACRTAAAQGEKLVIAVEQPALEFKVEPKEAFTAWGKEVGGLQAGLGFRPGEKRAYRHGETVKLVVRVRNVGKEPVKFEYLKQFFMETPPTATDSQGKPVFSRLDGVLGLIHLPVEVTLAAGKEIELYELKPELKPASDNAPNGTSVLHGTGTFQLQYDPVFGNSSLGGIKVDPTLSKLATGRLELEVKEAAKLPQKEKEAFTAWGKEINGLQAGVGFPAGQKRAYSHGETVTLVVRIRNVGKEAVTFQYVPAFFQETLPTVKHGTGEPVLPIRGVSAPGKTHPATAVTIAPGKEVELYEWNARLAHDPVAGGADDRGVIYHRGTGKLSVQYERVLGNSSASKIKIDPALSKLATGKLELEVKEPEKQPQKKEEKETFTAWGKEVDGLQAGLGFCPGEKRPYSHGETVKLVVRVRNVGKKEVTFKYIPAYFFDHPPSVTDGAGKAAPQLRLPSDGHEGEYNPKELTLAPGKEVELAEVKLELRPESESGNKKVNTHYGTGKFQIHYERLMYSSGRSDIGSILSDLATGKLEVEIKADPPKLEIPQPANEKELGASEDGERKTELRSFTVTGSVMEGQDKPLAGVVVKILRKAYAKDAKQPRIEEFGMTKTNSEGNFEITSLYAIWETDARSGFFLKFSATGFATSSFSVDKAFDPKKKIKIILKREPVDLKQGDQPPAVENPAKSSQTGGEKRERYYPLIGLAELKTTLVPGGEKSKRYYPLIGLAEVKTTLVPGGE